MNLKKIYFPGNQYIRETTTKDIFVIHHSAGWDNARNMFNHWANDSQGRIATAYGITDNGEVIQGFDTQFWAYAIYVNQSRNLIPLKYKTKVHDDHLNSRAIQVELCNWGQLEKKGTKFYCWVANAANNYISKYEIPKERVMIYEDKFRGTKYYEKYTDDEIESLRKLILFHHEKDGLELGYHEDMWDISTKALDGYPGIWTHVSYRTNKSDAHPQPELIQMLKELV